MKGISNSGSNSSNLPPCAAEYIAQVVRKVRYRKKVRRDIEAELTAHFHDELRDCATAEKRDAKARRLIEEFGDPKLLAILCRRAKKRCRPLWKKALVRIAQVVGVVVLYTVICTLPLHIGKPVTRVNYVEWLNAKWKPPSAEVENAKQYYDQAARLYVESSQPLKSAINAWGTALESWDAADLQSLGTWLTENRAAFDALRQGSNTAHYWPVFAGSPPDRRNVTNVFWMQTNVLSSTMKTLEGYRKVALAFRQQIAYEAHEGRVAEALDDCLILRQFGRNLQGKGFLNDQLISISIEHLGYAGIFSVLQRPDVSLAALERVQNALLAAFDEKRRVIDLEGEKVFWYDIIQRTFTDDGHGGGHALGNGFPFAVGTWSGNLARTFLFRYPGRRETTAMIERYFEQARAALSVPPSQSESERQWQAVDQTASENLFLALVAPAHRSLGRQEWRLKTHEVATITTLAILRYKNEKGQYPARLSEITETGYLQRLPDDPFGEGPLTYKRTDGGFLLYSLGPNLSDEGGRPSTDADGKPRMWTDNNDWVFWPVLESSRKGVE